MFGALVLFLCLADVSALDDSVLPILQQKMRNNFYRQECKRLSMCAKRDPQYPHNGCEEVVATEGLTNLCPDAKLSRACPCHCRFFQMGCNFEFQLYTDNDFKSVAEAALRNFDPHLRRNTVPKTTFHDVSTSTSCTGMSFFNCIVHDKGRELCSEIVKKGIAIQCLQPEERTKCPCTCKLLNYCKKRKNALEQFKKECNSTTFFQCSLDEPNYCKKIHKDNRPIDCLQVQRYKKNCLCTCSLHLACGKKPSQDCNTATDVCAAQDKGVCIKTGRVIYDSENHHLCQNDKQTQRDCPCGCGLMQKRCMRDARK